MSEHPPERAPDDERQRTPGAAPASYGTVWQPGQQGDHHGTRAPASLTGPAPPAASPGTPVYGPVTRTGSAGAALAGSTDPRRSWPPPAPGSTHPGAPPPWPPDASSPGHPPSGPPAGARPAPGPPEGGLPPWWTAPPAPRWRHDEYAAWSRRAAGLLIDNVPFYVAGVVLVLAYLPLYAGLLHGDLSAEPRWPLLVVGAVLYLAAFGWDVYNRWVRGGRTGQSLGKRVTGTWLVSVKDGRPVGVLNAFLRDLLHILDRLACVGYLWPLWDDQRQTLADKIIESVVVRTPVPPLTDHERASRP